MLDSTPRIGIGTANFGLKYGVVSNNQLEMNEIQSIFDQASRNKIDLIDMLLLMCPRKTWKINLNSLNWLRKYSLNQESDKSVIDDVKRALDVLGKKLLCCVNS